MSLDHYIQQIKTKRQQTPFMMFVRDVVSWKPIILHRNDGLISRFPPSDRIAITDRKSFEEAQNSLTNTHYAYNNELSFFENFARVLQSTKLPPTIHFFENENCAYGDIVLGSKNAYLAFAVAWSENVFYSESVKDHSSNVFNSMVVLDHSENIYMAKNIFQSFQVFYSKNILNSRDIWFSTNLQNCQECLLCDNLEGQSYCIKNVKYDKEAYMHKKEEILSQKNNFDAYFDQLAREEKNRGSSNVSGKGIVMSEDVENGYMTYRLHKGRNVIVAGTEEGNSNFFDVFGAGAPSGDDFYAVVGAGTGAQGIYCSSHINGGTNIFYSYYCQNCSYILGCVGLQNKEFCIFNTQYTKEERHAKAEEILGKMEQEGSLGEFFPPNINPFYYNDTAAYLLNPSISKEEVTKLGYLRRDEAVKVDIPSNVEIVNTNELENFEGFDSGGIRHIDLDIVEKIIVDDKGDYYRIVKMEYDFLLKYALPLPRKHWLDRLKMHFDLGLKTGS